MAVKPIVLPITYKSDPKGLRQAEGQLKSFANGIKNTVAGATLAVAGIGAASFKAFAEFDSAMTQSLAIMGDVSDAMRKDMSDAAREVAKTTTFSADQAAEAFYFLASAGLDAQASVGAMPKVAQFAQAGMFDLATATSLLINAQSAMGLSSDDAAENMENLARVSDVLVKANVLADASVQQFSEALTNKAAASMKSLNIPLEEGVAVLAQFASAGVKGSEAGTMFNAMIRGLTQGVQKNADEFDRLGIEVFDADGNLNNLADIVADIEGALDGMSVEQQRATLAALGFTEETLAGTLALVGNSEAIRDYQKDLEDAGGTTEEVANNQLKSLFAQFDLLKSAVIDIGIAIGEQIAPAFETFVSAIQPVIGQIGDALVPAFDELMVFIMDIAELLPSLITAFMPVLPIIVQLASLVFGVVAELLPLFVGILNVLLPMIESWTNYMSRNVETVTAVLVGVGSLIAIIKTFNTIVGVAKLAMLAYNAVLAANPIMLIVMAVAALIAGLVYFFTQTELGKEIWAGFVQFFKDLINGMVVAWQDLTQNFGAKWDEFVGGIQAGWQGFLDIFIGVGEGIRVAFTDLWLGLQEFFLGVGEFFRLTWEGFLLFFTEAWTLAKEGFQAGLEAVGEFFKGIINFYIGLWEGFINFFIGGINLIIRGLNRISFKVPDWVEGIGGKTFGISIPLIPEVALPRLAEGGIVKAQPGGILANIGEGRYDEAVVPLRPGMGLGATYNITVNAGVGTNGVEVGRQIVSAIRKYERSSGKVFASA